MQSLPLFPTGPLSTDTPPKKELRPYQDQAIRKLMVLVSGGAKRVLLVLPCGSGKMVLVSYIIRTATVPVLFVCHLRELVDQCVNELAAQSVHNVGVIRGDDDRYNPAASVQVASIQTLARRPPLAVAPGIILIDECHHAGSDSYVRLFRQYPDAIFIGFTASPSRLDGKPLGGELFQHLEVAATYLELLKRPDWLVAPDIYSTPLQPDLSQVETLGGDFQEDQLGLTMSAQPLVGDAVQHWLRLAHLHPVFAPVQHANSRGRMVTTLERVHAQFVEGERRRTFAFCANIHHSMVVAEAFERAGARVAHLDGKTPSDQRKAAMADMRSGKLEVACNVNLFLEGVDLPALKCIVHCRPTQSLVLWMQSTARAFRPWHPLGVSSENHSIVPLILDHAGNFDRHYAPHEDRQWSLSNRPLRKLGAVTMKLCRKCYAYVPPQKILCPYCGSEFPKEEPKTPQQTEEELVRRSADPIDTRRALFTKMALLARSRGYKPGFASAKFLDHYGVWPPRDWSDGLKALFASDEKWQVLNARREERKRLEAEEEKQWNSIPAEGSVPLTGTRGDYCPHDRRIGDSCIFCESTQASDATPGDVMSESTAAAGTQLRTPSTRPTSAAGATLRTSHLTATPAAGDLLRTGAKTIEAVLAEPLTDRKPVVLPNNIDPWDLPPDERFWLLQ
jgi:DNA repair protein RadD